MSNPQPDRLKPAPRRAEPLQPDNPGQGDATLAPPEKSAEQVAEKAAKKVKEQNETAHENVRKGYD